jgi:hypothetical protein
MASPAVMPLPCEEKRSLFVAYQVAAANYSQMVRQLASVAGEGVFTEFELLRRSVKEARKRVNEARERLDEHRCEHSCQGPIDEGHRAAAEFPP